MLASDAFALSSSNAASKRPSRNDSSGTQTDSKDSVAKGAKPSDGGPVIVDNPNSDPTDDKNFGRAEIIKNNQVIVIHNPTESTEYPSDKVLELRCKKSEGGVIVLVPSGPEIAPYDGDLKLADPITISPKDDDSSDQPTFTAEEIAKAAGKAKNKKKLHWLNALLEKLNK